jgi:hypothetical protein
MPSATIPALSRRTLSRLEAAEASEDNPHLACDRRISWITVLYAARGWPSPHVLATYQVLGLHPERVWPAMVERRKSQLGPYYEQFFGVDLPPRKGAASVREVTAMRQAA